LRGTRRGDENKRPGEKRSYSGKKAERVFKNQGPKSEKAGVTTFCKRYGGWLERRRKDRRRITSKNQSLRGSKKNENLLDVRREMNSKSGLK